MSANMRWIAPGICALIAMGPVCPDPVRGNPLVVDVSRAVELAYAHNRHLQIALEEEQRIGAQYDEVRSDLLPKFSTTAGYSRSWILPSTTFSVSTEDSVGQVQKNTQTVEFGTPNNAVLGLGLNQLVYRGGSVEAARRVVDQYSELNREKVRQTRQQVVLRVQEAVLNGLLAERSVTVAQRALEQAEAHLQQVRQLFGQGAAADFDVLRAEVQVANLRPEMSEAQNRLQLALEATKNAIGLRLDESLEIRGEFDDFPMSVPMDISAAQAKALEQRSALRQLDWQIRLQKENITIIRAALRPTVMLTGSYQWQWQLPDAWRLEGDDFRDSWVMGIAAQIPLFDGGKVSSQTQQARVDLRQLHLRREQLADDIRLQVKQAMLRQRDAEGRIRASTKTVEQAEKGLEIAEVRYESGIATQVEVLDVQVALTRARLNRLKSLYDHALAGVHLQGDDATPGFG